VSWWRAGRLQLRVTITIEPASVTLAAMMAATRLASLDALRTTEAD
jgi:hypothetical protein